jgi:hypothetical protein
MNIIRTIYETGLGFLQTLMGFIIVRFFYSIPIFLVWSVVLIPYTKIMLNGKMIFLLPEFPFWGWWVILVAFDCFRFDILKLVNPSNFNENEQ